MPNLVNAACLAEIQRVIKACGCSHCRQNKALIATLERAVELLRTFYGRTDPDTCTCGVCNFFREFDR